MKATRQGYNPDHAGNELLKACIKMRQSLTAKLQKPDVSDEAAFMAYIEAKITINRMDHKELRAAVAG